MAKMSTSLSLLVHLSTGFCILSHSGSEAFSGSAFPPRPCPFYCICDSGTRFSCIGDDTLEILDLQDFGMLEVPTFVGQFPNVRKIDLSGNVITIITPGAFRGLEFPELEELVITNNYITIIERGAFEVERLLRLDLSSNYITEFRFSVFSVIGRGFEFLNLRDNAIDSFILDSTPPLNRENYPTLTISIAENALTCSFDATPERLRMSPFATLCTGNFLENDGATCSSSPNTMPIHIIDYCPFVLSALSQPPPLPSGQPPATAPPPPEPAPPPPEPVPTSSNVMTIGLAAGISVVAFVIVLVLVTVLVITCICIKYKMWERKRDSDVINEVEQRLMQNKLKPYNYNQFHPLFSPATTPTPGNTSPRYTPGPIQKSPLPPVPARFPPGPFPGPTGGWPKLDKETGYPRSEEIYESIDGEEVYESSYIYNVESVPEKRPNTGDVPLPRVLTDTEELSTSDHESDESVKVTVVEAEVHINEGAIETKTDVEPVPSLRDQPVIRAKVNTSADATAEIETRSESKSVVSQADIHAAKDDQATSSSPLYTPIVKKDAPQLVSTETKVPVDDIEDMQAVASMSASMADSSESVLIPEGNESTVTSNLNQKPLISGGPQLPSEYLEPSRTATIPSAEESSTKEIAASINTNEREKRLSALKDVWASQDNEDVAYLQVVL